MVALVRGVHGLRGAVRVEELSDRPEARFVPGAVLYREGSDERLTIASAEAVADGPGWRIRFREIDSRELADTLRGAYLEAELVPETELKRGEVYWHETIGVTVRGVDGMELGTVRDVYRVAETEVFIVSGGPFGEFDVPAVRAFVRIFAPRRGEIVVDASALDLQPPKVRRTDPDRPRAPRRTKRKSRRGPDEASPSSLPSGEAAAGDGDADVDAASTPDPDSSAPDA